MLKQVADCEADETTFVSMEALARMIRDTSDCAIGYEAAQFFLQGLEAFSAEYQSHIRDHACSAEIDQTVPCETLCPAHVNIPAYIALAGAGDYAGAINMIRRDNPFPTACALVCEHPCETKCRRSLIDAPVNIRGIKKYIVDQVAADQVATPAPGPSTGKRIAVIGGGPSGLTCAYFLALMGHRVVVFERRPQLGGMLRYGIPAYRLPRERLDEDIRGILSAGDIEVKLEEEVGLEAMEGIAQDFDAVYLAIGAQDGKTLGIEGADAEGVLSAVDLLGAVGQGDTPDFRGKKVVVIGGGNVAMDCARTAVRAGADEVSVVYRRRKEDMTALPIEVESAIAEGVEMVTLESPVRIEVGADGQCVALITQPQMIGPVKGGRPAPVDADKPQSKIQADIVLIAVGQAGITEDFERFGMKASRGCFDANEYLEASGFDNIFVGGDCQTGPATAIKAIGAGRVAARNIDEYLGYHHTIDCDAEAPAPLPNDRTPKGRMEVAERPARERKHDFECVENPVSHDEAVQECGRCLRCDHYGCGTLEGGRIQYA